MKRKIDFDILESLRGLASLYVCIGHSRAILWIGGENYLKLHPKETLTIADYTILSLNMLTRLSSEFVIIFFVLSGFSIAHSLRNNTAPVPFYKRRFIRLYPPYVMAIVWAMAIVWGLMTAFPHFFDGTYQTPVFDRLSASDLLFNWKTFFLNLIYLPQLDGVLRPFWSLSQEVVFYLLAPFLFRNKKVYYSISALLFLLVNVTPYYGLINSFVPVGFLYYNFFFALGVALYDNFETVLGKAQLFVNRKALWLSLALFFIMVVVSLSPLEKYNPLLAAIMSMLLITYLVTNNIRLPWLINIGKFSYTLYITHFPTIFLFMSGYFYFSSATLPYIYNNLVFIPCVFVCLLIAYLHYNLVEKKTKYFLDKLRGKEENKKPVPAAIQPIVIPKEENKKKKGIYHYLIGKN